MPLNISIEFADPEFFSTPARKLQTEENTFAGRVYFLKDGRIVAVAKPAGDPSAKPPKGTPQ
jgi:hypothetical protein